jgi:hypothetical protein
MPSVRSRIVGAIALATAFVFTLAPAHAESSQTGTAPPPPPLAYQWHCFLGGDDGGVMLSLPGGYVTLGVATGLTFIQPTTLELEALDPSTVPAVPGSQQDGLVFRVGAENGCQATDGDQAPVRLTLGVFRQGAVPQHGLVLARLDGDQWVPLAATVDPASNGRLISTTIQGTGAYTVYAHS